MTSVSSDRVILAGGSGFLGRALADALRARGLQPLILTRSPSAANELSWDGRTLGPWTEVLEGSRAIVNLTGRNVNCRHTPANRREILDSRVMSVKVLADAIGQLRQPPPVWVQAGSLAFFGDRGDELVDESAGSGDDFGAEVCRAWEAAFGAAQVPATRKVFLRISFVLGRDDGALPLLAKFSRRFVGRLGNGRQYVSWIHLADFSALVTWAIENENARGIYNATAPQPVTNADLMAALAAIQNRRLAVAVPAWAIRLGSRLLGTEAELALGGRRGVPARLLAEHFNFRHADLHRALRDLYATR
jgi:uncharacterized protein